MVKRDEEGNPIQEYSPDKSTEVGSEVRYQGKIYIVTGYEGSTQALNLLAKKGKEKLKGIPYDWVETTIKEEQRMKKQAEKKEAKKEAKKAKTKAKVTNGKGKMVAKVKKEKAAKGGNNITQWEHKKNSMSGAIDEMIIKGTTEKDAIKVLKRDFDREEKQAKSKFKSHVFKHLALDHKVEIKEAKNGTISAS